MYSCCDFLRRAFLRRFRPMAVVGRAGANAGTSSGIDAMGPGKSFGRVLLGICGDGTSTGGSGEGVGTGAVSAGVLDGSVGICEAGSMGT